MTLKQDIAAWDGKSASDIEMVFKRHGDDKDYVRDLIASLEQTELQSGATWLLKHWLAAGHDISQRQVTKIYGYLGRLDGWAARLHVLQSLSYLPIQLEDKSCVEAFLRKTLTDDNKFVRAWSYNGLCFLAQQYPEYQEEVQHLLETALVTEAASVKARIRKLLKQNR